MPDDRRAGRLDDLREGWHEVRPEGPPRMLWFERRVVDALGTVPDPTIHAAVVEFVATSLLAMPDHLRLGVAAESVLLGGWTVLTGRARSPETLATQVRAWESHPVSFVRQYARLFGSLVLFAEQEHLPAVS